MPQAIAVYLVAYFGATGIAAAIITAVVYVAVSVAISYGLSAIMTKKPKLPSFMADATDRTQMVRQSAAPRRIIYGQCKVSGPLALVHTTGSKNEYLHLIIMLAGHECEEIGDIYLNDEVVPLSGSAATGKYAGYVRVNKHLGTTSQTVDTDLDSELGAAWTSTDRLREICYVYVRLLYDQSKFPGGLPNVAAIVKGKKVFDPRTSTTAWSQNAALCWRDYMIDAKRGLGVDPTNEIDGTAFNAAANICDESIVTDSGTEARYTINGTVDTSEKPGSVIEALLSAMGGSAVYASGKWYLKAAAYATPTVTLDENDMRGPITVQTKLSRRETCNRVKGVYVSPLNQWQPSDFPPVTNSTYLSEDGGEELWRDIQLPYTTSAATAQRLAKIELEKGRQQIMVQLQCKLTAYRVQAGDVVMLTNTRYGWTAKPFEVTDARFANDNGALGVDLSLRETASGVYDWADGEETTVDLAANTTMPDPFTVPTPSGLTLLSDSTTGILQVDGTWVPRLKVTWTVAGDIHVESGGKAWVEYKKHADSVWQIWGGHPGDTVEDYITDVKSGINYDVRVRFENNARVLGAYSTISNYTIAGDATAPATPTGVSAVAGPGCVIVDWADNTDEDLAGYDLYRATSNSFGSSSIIWSGLSSSHADFDTSVGTTYYYWLKAVDNSGNASSATATSVSGTPDAGVGGTAGADGVGFFTLVCRGNCVDLGGGIVKKVGGASAWDSDAYSVESYVNGAYVSFQANSTGDNVMVGLNTDPTADQNYTSLDYAWNAELSAGAHVYEGGSHISGPHTYSTSSVFQITYDGGEVRYLLDGTVIRTVSAAADLKLFLDSSFYTPGVQINTLRFGPMGAAGDPAVNSAQVTLYKRAGSTPSVPSTTATYTFATGVLTGHNNGWTQAIPALDGNPCYSINAPASAVGATDTIATGEWSSPVAFVQDGADSTVPGPPGADGTTAPVGSAAQGGDVNATSFGTYETAVSVSGTPGARPVLITGYVTVVNNGSASADFTVGIKVDGSVVASTPFNAISSGSNLSGPITVTTSVGSGSHTFALVGALGFTSGTYDWTLSAGTIVVV